MIIKYAERTGAVGLSMNDLFLGLWHPSVVMSPCHNLLSYSLMLQIDHLFWDPYSLLAIFCHLFERHLVLCSCNIISGQPLTGEGGSVDYQARLSVKCSSPVLRVSGVLRKSINRWSCTITEKALTRAFSWLKAPTSAFTFKTLLRHYAKRALSPQH